jgi:hypothetical protein
MNRHQIRISNLEIDSVEPFGRELRVDRLVAGRNNYKCPKILNDALITKKRKNEN